MVFDVGEPKDCRLNTVTHIDTKKIKEMQKEKAQQRPKRPVSVSLWTQQVCFQAKALRMVQVPPVLQLRCEQRAGLWPLAELPRKAQLP